MHKRNKAYKHDSHINYSANLSAAPPPSCRSIHCNNQQAYHCVHNKEKKTEKRTITINNIAQKILKQFSSKRFRVRLTIYSTKDR